MERLTSKTVMGKWTVIGSNQKAYDRLAAYEDTGLEPDKLNDMLNDAHDTGYQAALNYKGMTWSEAEELQRYRELGPIDHLRDLLQAEKDGKLVVLPCKPGGMVQFKGNPSDKSKVDAITIYADGRMTFLFHDYGVKETFVDEWSEDEAEKYMPCAEAEAAQKGEAHETDPV